MDPTQSNPPQGQQTQDPNNSSSSFVPGPFGGTIPTPPIIDQNLGAMPPFQFGQQEFETNTTQNLPSFDFPVSTTENTNNPGTTESKLSNLNFDTTDTPAPTMTLSDFDFTLPENTQTENNTQEATNNSSVTNSESEDNKQEYQNEEENEDNTDTEENNTEDDNTKDDDNENTEEETDEYEETDENEETNEEETNEDEDEEESEEEDIDEDEETNEEDIDEDEETNEEESEEEDVVYDDNDITQSYEQFYEHYQQLADSKGTNDILLSSGDDLNQYNISQEDQELTISKNDHHITFRKELNNSDNIVILIDDEIVLQSQENNQDKEILQMLVSKLGFFTMMIKKELSVVNKKSKYKQILQEF